MLSSSSFECARTIWLSNQQWAQEIIDQIRLREPDFMPSGDAAPPSYCLAYKLFGFSIAENIAGLKRKIKTNCSE
jgi:hypothetical protein